MRRSSREQISRETPARSEGLVRSACEVELCWHHDARSKVLPTQSKELPACGEELFGCVFCHPERSEGSTVQARGGEPTANVPRRSSWPALSDPRTAGA